MQTVQPQTYPTVATASYQPSQSIETGQTGVLQFGKTSTSIISSPQPLNNVGISTLGSPGGSVGTSNTPLAVIETLLKQYQLNNTVKTPPESGNAFDPSSLGVVFNAGNMSQGNNIASGVSPNSISSNSTASHASGDDSGLRK